jgi:hypothetical protein
MTIKTAGTGFNPLTFNQDVTAKDGGVYPADQVRLILDYHWQSENDYWRTHLCSALPLSNAIDTMSEQVPAHYIHRQARTIPARSSVRSQFFKNDED